MSRFEAERREVLDAARRIEASGLVAGASGNVSRRIITPDGNLIAITASRVPYAHMTLDDVLVVDFDVDAVEGDGVPSSESLLHVESYRARPDVHAVIHTHSMYASAFAVAGRPIPPVLDEQVVTLGGGVEVAAYGASASEELARNAVAALGERAAALLRNHGVVAVGGDLAAAIGAAELVERVARIYTISLGLGEVAPLPNDVVRSEQAAYRMMKGLDQR
jgi:L-fuculose-phosphate aldolase